MGDHGTVNARGLTDHTTQTGQRRPPANQSAKSGGMQELVWKDTRCAFCFLSPPPPSPLSLPLVLADTSPSLCSPSSSSSRLLLVLFLLHFARRRRYCSNNQATSSSIVACVIFIIIIFFFLVVVFIVNVVDVVMYYTNRHTHNARSRTSVTGKSICK